MFVFLHFLNCLVQEAQQAVNAVIAQVYSNDTQVIESILLSCMLYNIIASTFGVLFMCRTNLQSCLTGVSYCLGSTERADEG